MLSDSVSTSTPCLPDGPPTGCLPPSLADLDYSFGLPGGPYALSLARELVRRLLDEHGLSDMAELGVFAASEMLGNCHLFSGNRETDLSLRWRFGVLRLTVFDRHPLHAEGLGRVCLARRRVALSTLDAVVDACGGICRLEDARQPLVGSKVWVVFSREAARRYAEC
ncbi:hypothetical protein I5Q34_00675 [Streptomyces sp. AV19]|uniref:hypothetical protein n=1 Tax=Streptomyces sp. AV19 TaxID=2793068 RepID=UPI0018FEB0ED|nr:hypothetical protein [Streptomyces sp. AV19]MBH1932822.1 hypothetical protein [Streptomyces sp. AV19]MDG4531487.1 hypothetical protein [Streptomyces sp. AV19]